MEGAWHCGLDAVYGSRGPCDIVCIFRINFEIVVYGCSVIVVVNGVRLERCVFLLLNSCDSKLFDCGFR